MKKQIYLNESQYKLLFESEDNPEEKIRNMLNSGLEENIEIAFMFMDSQNLNKKSILRPYLETFQFLKKYREIYYDSLDAEAYIKLMNKTQLMLKNKKIKIVPQLNLPLVRYLNLSGNKLIAMPNIQLLPSLHSLELRDTNLPIEALDFNQLANLKWLYLTGNNYTSDEQKRIKQSLPNTILELI